METAFVALLTPPPPMTDLVLSVLVGVAQMVIGWLLAVRLIHPTHRRMFIQYALAALGIWLIGSGLAEVCVSGLMLSARLTGVPGPDIANGFRPIADTGLFYLAGVLLVLLALYPWWRHLYKAVRGDEPT